LYETVKQDIFSVQSKPNILGDNTLYLITYFRRNTCTIKMRLHLLILLLKLVIFLCFIILSSLLGSCGIHFLAVKNNRFIWWLLMFVVVFFFFFFFLLHHLYLIGCTRHVYKFQNSFNTNKSIIKRYFMAILQDHRIKYESYFPQIIKGQ
jgi:hypothetical protein